MQKITLLFLFLCSAYLSAGATDIEGRPELRGFIDEMVKRHDFDRGELARLFAQVNLRPDIIEAITTPAEKKPWRDYRPIFVNQGRIRGGVEFWSAHAQALARAERTYGVAPEIIVAIIGVETRYGKNTGSYRVLDALTMLAFDYPARSAFFRGELEHYLLFAREEHFDAAALKGSYAGAMGLPQFIPSSYRRYAVDFDNDGRRDLWNNVDDVIGSVANYLSVHGWQSGAPVASRARVSGEKFNLLIDEGLKPELSFDQLQHYGVVLDEADPPSAPKPWPLRGALLALEGDDGTEYWVGMQNFYAITRYNTSVLYAMAVYQLSREIKAQRQ